ncbi:MAG: DNA replication and repair protein RecF, partial [Bacteroidales bacterium]|nr:DNA replication and repair protein RecF [Bacteroidales bacterium]
KMERISFELMETINERMAPDAAYIYNKRSELCSRLQELIKCYYGRLSGDKEEISLEYTSDLDRFITLSSTPDEALTALLESVKERDALLRYTSAGVQRDDVEFTLGEHPIKKCGSQGQQKSFLIALKLAQFTLMKELHGCTPILLLDDVFDKLDMQRVEYLLGLVASEDFGQIFITDSNKVRMDKIASSFTDKVASFEVVSGEYKLSV